MKTQPKIDLYKLHKADYAAPKKPVLIDVGPASYLAISGQGEPGGDAFVARIGALYGVAFTVKMTRKFGGMQDYAVCKLEAQWFFNDDPARTPKARWKWKLLIRTPDFVRQEEIDQAAAAILKKGKGREASEVKLETITEGNCVQMLHVGPYDRERETIAAMHAFAEPKGLTPAGPHHEVYISDPRRVPAERLKTILRQPVAAAVATRRG